MILQGLQDGRAEFHWDLALSERNVTNFKEGEGKYLQQPFVMPLKNWVCAPLIE